MLLKETAFDKVCRDSAIASGWLMFNRLALYIFCDFPLFFHSSWVDLVVFASAGGESKAMYGKWLPVKGVRCDLGNNLWDFVYQSETSASNKVFKKI